MAQDAFSGERPIQNRHDGASADKTFVTAFVHMSVEKCRVQIFFLTVTLFPDIIVDSERFCIVIGIFILITDAVSVPIGAADSDFMISAFRHAFQKSRGPGRTLEDRIRGFDCLFFVIGETENIAGDSVIDASCVEFPIV